MTLWRAMAAGAALALLATGCAGTDPNAPQTRTVLVDYSHDEFASYFLDYFPNEVSVRPGDTVEFKQTWTGEPHSVTMGTFVDKMGEALEPYFEAFEEGGWEALPDEPPAEIMEIEKNLPWMFQDDSTVAQNGAQPCYLDSGTAPDDPGTPCPEDKQVQPPFNGRQSYYNSGFIPYEGPSGNTFRLPIAEDAKPGKYFYYCNLHGQFMSGWVNVVERGSEIPSQAEVSRAARDEIEKYSNLMREDFERAVSGKFVPPKEAVSFLRKERLMRGRYYSGYFSGLQTEGAWIGGINEFIPKDVTVKAGERVSWVMLGGHTISFNVPKYFPIIEVKEDGSVVRNPRLDPPAGGAPPIPGEDEEEHETEEPPPGEAAEAAAQEATEQEEEPEGPPEPQVIDAGTFDGEGFWSSGLIYPDPFLVYHLRFAKPGTYKYACLVHPPMVGTIEVEPA